MAIYNLEETPDVFITPQYYGNEFEYAMVHINGESDRKTTRVIDLRSDKLMVYGTEIQESSLRKLYESLIIRPTDGIMYYNCDGACYFRIDGKGCYRPIHNVIFDWSAFGVTVPNPFNSSLKIQLEQKGKAMDHLNHQLSSSVAELISTKADLQASMKEVEELKVQLSTCNKDKDDIEVKLQEACQRNALVDFELELYKIELDSYKKSEEELLDQICSCKDKCRNMEIELEKVQAQLSFLNYELQSSKIEIETSNGSIKEFGHQLSLCRKESHELERELRRVEQEHSLVSFELKSIKCEKQYLEEELRNAYYYLCSIDYELMSINKKLDQLLISKLWDEIGSCHNDPQSSQKVTN